MAFPPCPVPRDSLDLWTRGSPSSPVHCPTSSAVLLTPAQGSNSRTRTFSPLANLQGSTLAFSVVQFGLIKRPKRWDWEKAQIQGHLTKQMNEDAGSEFRKSTWDVWVWNPDLFWSMLVSLKGSGKPCELCAIPEPHYWWFLINQVSMGSPPAISTEYQLPQPSGKCPVGIPHAFSSHLAGRLKTPPFCPKGRNRRPCSESCATP